MNNRLGLIMGALLVLLVASIGYGQGKPQNLIKVNGAGMASDQVLGWANEFMKSSPGINVVVTGSSAGKGFQSLLDGEADIAMMSREIRPDERKKAGEKNLQIAERTIGHAGIALVTHPRNPVSDLTLDQLRKLYTGQLDNWKQVGGPDEPVRCLSRKIPASGGAVFFWKKVLGEEPFGPKTMLTETWGTIIKVCSVAKDLPIGIAPATRKFGSVKVLRIRRDDASPAVAPTEENIKSRAYPIILTFSFVWNSKSGREPTIERFVDFCQKQGGGN